MFKKNNPDATGATDDQKIKMYVQIEQGDGRYKKGLFKKTSMLNFNLHIRLEDKENIKIKSVEALIKSGKSTINKKLPCCTNIQASFDLPTKEFSGLIQVTVTTHYSFGLFKTKEIKATVSKQF